MDYKEFASKVKAKYPQYGDMNDMDLAKKMVAKFPSQYADVTFNIVPEAQAGQFGEGKASAIRAPYPSERVFGPITEGIAQMGGGLLRAAKSTPMGAGIAGAIGTGLEIGRQATQAAFGEPGAPQSFGESLERQAGAFATGVGGELLGRGMFAGVGKVLGPAELNPNQRIIKNIADKYNVPLTPADVKGTKMASLLESLSEKSLVAGNIIQRFRQGQVKAFNNAANELIEKSGGKIDKESAGNMVKEILDTRAEIAKEQTNLLYSQAREAAEKTMDDQYKRFVQNDNLMSVVDDVFKREKSFGPEVQSKASRFAKDISDNKTNYTTIENFDNLRSKLKDLIRIEQDASKLPGRTTPDGMKFTKMLVALEKDYDNYYKNVNPEARGLYDLAKASAKGEYQLFGNKYIKQLSKSAPEKVVDSIIKPNNVTAIKAVKSAVGDEGFEPIKRSFLKDLIESTQSTEIGATPTFKPSALANQLAKYEDETLSAIFKPSELAEIKEIAKLSSAMQRAEGIGGNVSGTAQISQAQALVGGSFLASAMAHPIIAATGLGMPIIIANAMTSPTGRKLMIDGLKVSPGSKEAAKAITRFATFSALASAREKKQK